MSILTRRIGESLMVGDDVKVTVLSSHGHQTRIGIRAPTNISVHRIRIYQKIKRKRPRNRVKTLDNGLSDIHQYRKMNKNA